MTIFRECGDKLLKSCCKVYYESQIAGKLAANSASGRFGRLAFTSKSSHSVKPPTISCKQPASSYYSAFPHSTNMSSLRELEERPSLRSSSGPDMPSSIQDILCINCQEMVNLTRIAIHSLACTQVTPEVRSMEIQENTIETIKFKIKKLNSYLKRQKNSHAKSPGDRNIIGILQKLSDRLLLEESIATIKAVLESLEALIATFQGSLSVLVYIERLKGFAGEMKEERLSVELESKDLEIQALKAALEDEVTKAEIIERNKARQLSEIESMQSSSVSGSKSASDTAALEEFVENPFSVEEISNPEDSRKAFYAQCLSIKLSLHSRSKGLKVSVPSLYEKVIRDSVPPEQWAAFIKENLANPDKALMQRSKTHPKFAATEMDTRFDYFSVPTIKEAEAGTELD